MRGPVWRLVIAAAVPVAIGGCAAVREGPWRTTAEAVRAHGVLAYADAWWPAPGATQPTAPGWVGLGRV